MLALLELRCCDLFTDKAMQLNQARFMMYNNCGFVPKPEFMDGKTYKPHSRVKLEGVDPLIINIQVNR